MRAREGALLPAGLQGLMQLSRVCQASISRLFSDEHCGQA